MKSIVYILLAGSILILPACSGKPAASELYNDSASLPASFNFDRMGLKVMTSFINKKQGTTATLYANAPALKTAIAGTNDIAAGEALTLVTWKQKADAHWFGANIPGDLQSVEVVKTISSKEKTTIINYACYEGKSLVLKRDTIDEGMRIKYIFDQKPTIMP